MASTQNGASITIIADNTAQVVSDLKRSIYEALDESGQMVENNAVGKVPVDTGRLRNSITHQMVDDNTVEIGSDVEYAIYVECGTSRSRKQPYLVPALTNNADWVEKIFRDKLS